MTAVECDAAIGMCEQQYMCLTGGGNAVGMRCSQRLPRLHCDEMSRIKIMLFMLPSQ